MIRFPAMFLSALALSFTLFTGPALAKPLQVLAPAPQVNTAQNELHCRGPKVQGGFVLCSVPPQTGRYRLGISGSGSAIVSHAHPALIPFARNSELNITITPEATSRNARSIPGPVSFTLDRGKWDIERIDGLPPSKVKPRTPEQQKKVEADWLKKQAAWKHRAAASWYATGFDMPVTDARISGHYGSQRILNGEPGRAHLGMDFAAPKGTKIVSPASAIIVLAEPDMYFEGGLLVLDHGAGVMSVMMHMSRIDVKVGDQVSKGQTIGAIGMTGRATGPHLHWGIKVRGTYINPALAMDFAPGP